MSPQFCASEVTEASRCSAPHPQPSPRSTEAREWTIGCANARRDVFESRPDPCYIQRGSGNELQSMLASQVMSDRREYA